MIRIINVVGARPQIIKASAVSRAIAEKFSDCIEEIIVHTGQHYDDSMSAVFFEELKIPIPKYNLQIGSSTHGIQTARIIEGLEDIILKETPDYIIVYGDTNSTIAAAIAASKLHYPIIHIEAGLRSFNKRMPEEINRIVCDHVSTLLFTPTEQGLENLYKEGFKVSKPPYTIDHPGVFHVGDIMYDNSRYFAKLAESNSNILDELGITGKDFILVTIHRDNNTDDTERLNRIFNAFFKIIETYAIDFVIPLHPRTEKVLKQGTGQVLYERIKNEKHIVLSKPASFLDMIQLEKNSRMIITDSGGVQKESHFFKKPCIILRPETEWIELVKNGTAIITDADTGKITDAFTYFYYKTGLEYPNFYGDGNAGTKIIESILELDAYQKNKSGKKNL